MTDIQKIARRILRMIEAGENYESLGLKSLFGIKLKSL
mgnify:CR=1 FL=1